MTITERLERAAEAAFLAGDREQCSADWASAHHRYRDSGDTRGAARCAFWLGFCFLLGGEVSLAQGWLARARRFAGEHDGECAEQGYLLLPDALGRLGGGDAEGAYELFQRAADLGERLGEVDLATLGGLGRAQAAIALGRTDVAVRSLDEVMVAVTADEVSPIVAGLVHCAAIEACQEMFDVRRAQEWTAALTHWCDARPDLVQFRGQCLVHRSELLQLRGEWSGALDEARHAYARLSADPAAGMALYQLGELQRLRGQFAEAEDAYREASLRGRSPQPGMARLRLAQGQVDAALAGIRRSIDEANDVTSRSTMLAAYVEVALAADDVPAARAAADELAEIAERLRAPMLDAMSAHAAGAVLVGERAARRALAELRRAWSLWRSLDAPYHAAKVRVLVGLACQGMGDEDGAEMEFDAARTVFRQLGAAPDLAAVDALSVAETATATATASFGLTAREVEVLALVATGRTNRAIAAELVISEKTVARHLSNIFTKLGLSSRAAATAYAYEHGVMTSST